MAVRIMRMHTLSTRRQWLVACVALGAIGFGSGAEQSPVSPPQTEAVAPTPVQTDLGQDPFVGRYVGTFHTLGTYEPVPNSTETKFTPQTCGTCHLEASVERNGPDYVLTMIVDHGQDKQGNPKKERLVLKAEAQDGALSFRNANYLIRFAQGEASGTRTGKMTAELKLQRQAASPAARRAMVGAYYFDGWAGQSDRWRDDPAWTRLNPPTHLSKRLVEEFAEREPIWGWRDDSLEVMERQIDLAADHGIAFFAFCWYWHKDPAVRAKDPKHTGLELFLKARNNQRMKFCLLVANHAGFLLEGTDQWRHAGEAWLGYFRHPQHVQVGGKPLVIIFNPSNSDPQGFEAIQAVARAAGLSGVAIAGCGGGDRQAGFTHTTHYNIVPGYAGTSEAHPFSELVQAHQRAWRGSPAQPHIPTLSVGWDKRPWEGPRGLGQRPGWYFVDRTPEQFAAALESAIAWMDTHPEQTTAERIVLLYAWNEFGEGGYLAPTKGDPEGAYLQVIRQVVVK